MTWVTAVEALTEGAMIGLAVYGFACLLTKWRPR